MYAIISAGGKQYQVAPGDVIDVEKIAADEGEMVTLNQVLMISDESALRIGQPYLENAEVKAKVLRHDRSKKVIVFKFKKRKQYRRTKGHRQDFTRIRIDSITA